MSNSNTDVEALEQYDLYRIIKLTTGELLICTMVDEGDNSITFEHPIEMEFLHIVSNNGIRHELSTMAYCPFAEDRTFTVPRSQVQHLNNLSKDMIKSYLRMVFSSEVTEDGSNVLIPEGATIH